MADRKAILVGLAAAVALCAGDAPRGRSADQAALKAYAGLVGPWKGTGQLQRNSTKGAWRESADWAWSLDKESAGLRLAIGGGKYLRSATLRPGRDPGSFALSVETIEGARRTLVGKPGERGVLVLTDAVAADGIGRVTLTPLHDTRFLLKLEARTPEGRFRPLGEVGYTRQGVAFATGDTGPVCIVTEGRGTIPVTYKGKTYYVCCGGCRDLFNDDPDSVLAEAKARTEAAAKK